MTWRPDGVCGGNYGVYTAMLRSRGCTRRKGPTCQASLEMLRGVLGWRLVPRVEVTKEPRGGEKGSLDGGKKKDMMQFAFSTPVPYRSVCRRLSQFDVVFSFFCPTWVSRLFELILPLACFLGCSASLGCSGFRVQGPGVLASVSNCPIFTCSLVYVSTCFRYSG